MKNMVLLAIGLASASPQDEPRDWGETLSEDAAAIHEAISSSHPGTINPDDPEFAIRNDEQLRVALERAETADSFADYFYAMQHYVATFDDGHMSFGVFGNTPDLNPRWPGFFAKDDGNRGLLVTESEDWSGVPVGASILSCDGRSAFEVGDARMGARFGRWELASQRYRYGPLVMVDTGDPYVEPIAECTFATDSSQVTLPLDWRAAESRFIYSRIFPPVVSRPQTGMRQLENGIYWITLPTFNGNPESDAGRALEALVGEIGSSADRLRAAPAIVFDLRGNGGGSSDWSSRIAAQIWGEGASWRHPEPPMTVVWRASQANLQSLRDGLAESDANGALNEDARRWYRSSIAGLESALAAGEETRVIEPIPSAARNIDVGSLPYHPPQGPVYVLVDAVCMSACLDAVDIWTRLGAVPVGRETGADTIYMEIRSERMPSGLGSMSLPMKYYIGRQRGHNESVSPTFRFDGDMADTAALERWIAQLPG